ncbi:hypothetical protein TraAM80_03718 [Trypanosoma rangeli]|uniref:Uncharacterized protein n=1 Tax=Trypanosoma rangeli TaxID=5698 RepID=A0A422NN29_TRYRA|nr:uncharacterized protein TraAM80_03718 [Trypanosoma rangeli]RNF06902.1 hypothetical protein TraAM80_03718 [Trypanosoma rangeli]|eukprot:RNF06902.1 hypothetical protein TraAM80_03718 [Trypanosoma rangeli]
MQLADFSLPFHGYTASMSDSSSGSFHRSGPAPTLPLAATVGSRVVLTSKNCNHDAFIWEDKKTDLLYLRCAMRHMLVGNVLRETDTHLLVCFDIPYHCLPPGVWSRRANKCSEEGMTEGNVGGKNGDDDDADDGVKIQGGGKIAVDAEEDTGPSGIDVFSSHDEPEAEREGGGGGGGGGGSAGGLFGSGGSSVLGPIRFVMGIVPVLALTQENAAVERPHVPHEEMEKLRSCGTATPSTAPCSSENVPDVLHVSLSVTRSGCISLLQSLLEQHEKLECVSSAVANRDLKLAARHIMAVIDARWSLAAKQRGIFRGVNDSQRSSPAGLQTHLQPPGTDAGRRTDDIIPAERRCRFVMVFHRDKENSSCLEFHPLMLSTGNEEEAPQSGTGSGSGSGKGGSSMGLPPTDVVDLHSVGLHKLPALQFLWRTGSALKELAPLYALLSFLRFQDGQYEQCVEDAVTALAYDCTCIEAYTRLMSGFIALGGEQEAIVTAAVAVKRCSVLNPQFARVSRLAYVCAFYHRNLGKHSLVDVSPRLRQASVAEVGSFRDATNLAKMRRSTCRSTTVRMRTLSNSFITPPPFSFVPPSSLRSILSGASPPMEYFLRCLRARAACSFELNEIVFSEEVPLQVLLWTMPGCEHVTSTAACAEVDAGLADSWINCRARFCAYCGHALVSRSVLLAGVCERTSKAMADRVCWNFSEKKSVPCLAGCGEHYCNEICRNRAALEYHWIECAMSPAGEAEAMPPPPPPHERGIAGDTVGTRGVVPFILPSGREETHGSLLELFPLATLPLKRPSMCGFMNFFRHLRNQQQRLDAVHTSRGLHGPMLRQDGSTFSGTETMTERDMAYKNSIQACCSVLPGIRAHFSTYYAAVRTAILEKAPNATTAALLIVGRLLASVLRLFIPEAATRTEITSRGQDCFVGVEKSCLERVNAVRTIVERYASRGFTSGGRSPSDLHDRHGLCLAEEVLQQLRVPFFADTNLLQPSTVWEVLGEAPTVANTSKDESLSAAAVAAKHTLRCGFDRAVELLRAIDAIVQSRLCDEAVAFSLLIRPEPVQRFNSDNASVGGGDEEGNAWTKSHLEDSKAESCDSGQGCARRPPFVMDVGTLAVWLAEEHSKVVLSAGRHPAVWTFGRLLGFLGKRRFMEQFWDFCVSSYCVVPRCVLSVGVDDTIPEHLQEGWRTVCRQYTVLVAVMGPLTSLVTDLSAFGGESCSRFFKDAAPTGPRNPLHLRMGDSLAGSMLSINSLTHDSDELHTRAAPHGMDGSGHRLSQHVESFYSAAVSLDNLELCGNNVFNRSGERRVTMKAQRPIASGEELRYRGKDLVCEDTER